MLRSFSSMSFSDPQFPSPLQIDLFAMPRSSDEYGLWPRLLGSRHGRRMRNLMPARTLTGRYAATAQTVASQAQPASTSPSSSTCNSTSYFDGVQCQLCSACGIGEVVSIPCTYDSNTVCIGGCRTMLSLVLLHRPVHADACLPRSGWGAVLGLNRNFHHVSTHLRSTASRRRSR